MTFFEPGQAEAISRQIDMMELVCESFHCEECKHFNHNHNGCNHGHITYCGKEEMG